MTSSDLATYQLQLQQVEVALTADPDSSELLKLKEDLEQVIQLTRELISSQLDPGQAKAADDDFQLEKSGPSTSTSSSSSSRVLDCLTPVKHWQVGEQCQALLEKDGLYYEARINEITTDGEVSVTFRHNNGGQGVTSLGLLKISKQGFSGSASQASRKEQLAKERENAKRRKAKKAERFKSMEKEREKEKNKWQSFSTRAFGKKGFVKKSIFKTPETAAGRVGVGTCGVGGQKMTTFNVGNQYRKENKK